MGRKTRWLRRIAFALLVLAVLYSGAWLVTAAVARSRLAEEIAAIRARAEPLTLVEMAPLPLPEADNGAIPMLEAEKSHVDANGDFPEVLDRFVEDPYSASDEEAVRIRAWVERNGTALGLLEDAVAHSEFRYDVDLSDPLEASGPPALWTVRAARLLRVRALLAARGGDTDAAWIDGSELFRLSAAAGDTPTVLSFLVRQVVREKALETMRLLIPKAPPPPAVAAAIVADLDGIRVADEARRAFLGERAFGHACFERIPGGYRLADLLDPMSRDGHGLRGLFLDAIPSPVLTLDHARYLSILRRAIDLLGRPWHDAAPEWKTLAEDAADAPWYALLGDVLLSNLAILGRRFEEHRAHLDLARIALAGDPGGETERGTIDPFTGHPYERFAAPDGESRIRGAGPDGRPATEDDVSWPLR